MVKERGPSCAEIPRKASKETSSIQVARSTKARQNLHRNLSEGFRADVIFTYVVATTHILTKEPLLAGCKKVSTTRTIVG